MCPHERCREAGGAAHEVDGEAARNQDQSKAQRAHAQDVFIAAAQHGESQQQRRTNPQHDRADHASGSAEGTAELRFFHPQRNQRGKFQQQAQAVKQDINRDQPLKAQTRGTRPIRRRRPESRPRERRCADAIFRKRAATSHPATWPGAIANSS